MARARGAPKSGGRRKGTPNRLTADVKQMVVDALNGVGGVKYLMAQAAANPAAFMVLVGKVLPLQVQGDRDTPLEHRVTFAERQREAIAAVEAAFEEHEPQIAAAAPPAIDLRGAEGETLPLPRGFTREGELDPTPAPLPVRHRTPRAVGGWVG